MSLPPITGVEQYVDGGGRLTFEGQQVFAQMRELILAIEAAGMNVSQFGERLVTERTPIIELNSAYGTSLIRDVKTTSGSAAISASTTGEILLSTGTTASSTARIDSSERLRYVPGFSAEVGIGIRIPADPTGNQEAKWGIRNPAGTEGIYFGVDATGFYIATLRNSTETIVRQSSFNVDRADGTGPSGLNIDLSKGNIFQLDFTWYGYGQIKFDIVEVVNGEQKPVTLHQLKPSGATSVQTPNLPIFVEATNGGDTTDFDVYLGGRQASIVGRYEPKFRTMAQYRSSISTTTTAKPMVSFRNKSGFEDRSVLIDAATAKVATQDHIIEVYLNPSLTGASWVTPTNATAAETALETDISATAMSGGTLVYSYFATSGSASTRTVTSERSLLFDVPENQILTMAARAVTGTGTASGLFRVREEW